MSNVAFFLFPNLGSHYDPRVTTPILVAAAVGVVWGWSGRTLGVSRLGGYVECDGRTGKGEDT
jgi:hypothetical protein